MASEPQPAASPRQVEVFVGAYTAGQGGQARGLSVYRSRAADAHRFDLQQEVRLDSPSYLLAHPTEPWLFAVCETVDSAIVGLRRDRVGRLSVINSVRSGSDGGCHLAFDPTGRFLLVAHYGSGTVTSYQIGTDGRLSDRLDLLQLYGSGTDPKRQDHSYAHQVVVDGDHLLVADLGGDAIHRIDIDRSGVLTETKPAIQLPAGFGPRHLVVVEGCLVVVGELSGQLWLARREDAGRGAGTLCPASGQGASQPSAIRADGNLIFVGNRGPDTISVFRLEPAVPILQPVAEFSSMGAWPRDIALTDSQLWVANQNGHVISVFDRYDDDDAQYPLAFRLSTPNPASVCLPRFDRHLRIGQSSQL